MLCLSGHLSWTLGRKPSESGSWDESMNLRYGDPMLPNIDGGCLLANKVLSNNQLK